MRDYEIRARRVKKFKATTNSRHNEPVAENVLWPGFKVSELDKVRVSDISYIRLLREFIYLAVILYAYSRRYIGWALDRRLEAELAIGALKMAFGAREVKAGLVHHSDRGVQYGSHKYTGLLEEAGIRISREFHQNSQTRRGLLVRV